MGPVWWIIITIVSVLYVLQELEWHIRKEVKEKRDSK